MDRCLTQGLLRAWIAEIPPSATTTGITTSHWQSIQFVGDATIFAVRACRMYHWSRLPDMHSYQHNIKTFNNATRHLTHVERALYRDLIELYYDTEQPLPARDIDALCRRVLARSDDEKTAVKCILDEFFVLTGDVYTHDYCDEVIDQYKRVQTSKAIAGKASAKARKEKADRKKYQRRTKGQQKPADAPTPVEQPLNECSAPVCNHKPETINHITTKTLAQSQPETPLTVAMMPTNRYNTEGELFRVTEDMVASWSEAFPGVDVRMELSHARVWLQDNPTKRKTANGMRRFLGSWMSREQDRPKPGGDGKPKNRSLTDHLTDTSWADSTRKRSLHDDLTDTSWADLAPDDPAPDDLTPGDPQPDDPGDR